MTDNRTRLITASSKEEYLDNLTACAADFQAIYARCAEVYPEFCLSESDFRAALVRAVDKYMLGFAARGERPSTGEIRQFIGALKELDLYLTLACACGNEPAWWQFDRQYRSFIERVARHLAGSGTDADEVIESVYVDLFGTRVEGGVRQSKFRTYTGRGSLRGWLRTIIWHTVVDLYRRKQDEVPLEDFSRSGDKQERQTSQLEAHGSEELMLTNVLRERYKSLSGAALDESLATLDDHETLLLLYYHVEGLKLREIARLVEQPASPIRRWFQQQSKRRRRTGASSRVHESTVMRWLEKVYRKVSDRFHSELANKYGLNEAEIEICQSIATEDVGQSVKFNPITTGNAKLSKGEGG
ncbi:MAG: sigma-70 family RNA polymerase sigma factor [Pyrinomonadaceae bacterium]|nr:sigma-70 family RNA polymerase sigma factor [Pyrinomonadaceae bacterium]